MKGLRTGLAAATLLMAAGCGGSGSDSPPNKETRHAAKIQLADACPKVQDALDSSFPSDGIGTADQYQEFGTKIAALVKRVDPKGVPLLSALQSATDEASKNLDSDPLAGPWLDAMKRVSDTCQQLGAPLS